MIRLFSGCVAVTLAASCVHHPPLPPLHATRLLVRESEGAVVPLVHLTVAGKEVFMILDTGADQSILPNGFVHDNGLKPETHGAIHLDVNDTHVFMSTVLDVPVQFDGEAAAGKMDFLMGGYIPGGVGILAPQTLIASGWALTLDFANEELRYDPEEVAVRRLRAGSTPVQELAFRPCPTPGLVTDDAHRVVKMIINGVEASMLIDTGASRTLLYDDNPARPSLVGMKAKRDEVQGVGAAAKSLTVESIPMTFAGSTVQLRASLLPSRSWCGEGLLGADLLRHCQIIWGKKSMWAACRTG